MRSWPSSATAKRRVAVAVTARDVPRLPAGAVRILGLDPGLRHTGWGVIEAHGNKLSYISDGVIEPDPTLSLAERLHHLFSAVAALTAEFTPAECAIEDTFVNKNPTSTLKLGHARAAAMLGPASANVPVFEYKPNLVKKSVVGAGHADKTQIAAMIGILLPGSRAGSPDAADALAVAVCHAHHRVTRSRLAKAMVAAE
ncbi:MAG: crossover junction endodeoxyribonuclease RuvC [Rhodospirillaceae bacterium]|nr:crossover junction endodeoxyribonuclease RuvC [Rhodospirillaceae bacterium]